MSATLAYARCGGEASALSHRATLSLGMAQLAPKGLAEVWWLKHLGDVHWQLIARALGQQTTVFRDQAGRQMYAAFCATEFAQFQPDLVSLGAEIELHSSLWAAGRSRIQSNHILYVKGVKVASFRLVSTFVAHIESGINASVRRVTPRLVPVLLPAPDGFAKKSSQHVKSLRSGQPQKMSQTAPLFPSVGSDFNAVGLLYFPSFTRLFDELDSRLNPRRPWAPIRQRQIYYFGNIEQGDALLGACSDPLGNAQELWTAPAVGVASQKIAHCMCTRF
ncbi:probable biosynthetic protein, Pnap_2097 family [Epibacterium ulvae]|uniref:Probable biosynthetic protein, Pnap_2097 family n=1 Tax=Epibacterium ulvae TaxID=1156985 RepID=A0A1G5R190_9RHOB|nr:Pnap_2097 family protein [Epibacterium ulvae]SCZ67864.1 probable biosynthetic protein, Pnap_2097 family [Epibacterium ulvae]